MPTFKITDPGTGQVIRMTGDTPPSQRDIQRAFLDVSERQKLDPTRGESPASAARIALGKGFTNVGRGLQTLFNMATFDDEANDILKERQRRENELFAPLEEEFPVSTGVGEIAGEIAASAPLGVGVGSLAAGGLARAGASALTGRVLGATAAGATEGLITGLPEEKGVERGIVGGAVGGALELALPPVLKPVLRVLSDNFGPAGRAISRRLGEDFQAGGNLVQQTSEGIITPSAELDEALARLGTTFDEVQAQALREVPATEQTAQQAARAAAFAQEGVTPSARSRITNSHDQAQAEVALARQTGSASADELRDRIFNESQQVTARFNQVAEELGVGAEAGTTIKNALELLNSSMRSNATQAYEELGTLVNRMSPDQVTQIPLSRNDIINAANRAQRVLSPQTRQLVDETLARYGLIGGDVTQRGRFTTVALDTDDAGNVIDSVRFMGETTPLNLGNAHQLRQDFNQIFNNLDNREVLARGEITSAIDTALEDATTALGNVGVTLPESIVGQARQARALVRERKVTFDQRDLITRLTGNKPGTVTPLVEASRAFGEIQRAPNEQVSKLVGTLSRGDAGEAGEQALKNLQSATVLNLLERATSAASRKLVSTTGEQITGFSGAALKKALNKDRAKINIILRDQPEIRRTLNRLEAIGDAIITPASAVQKGSAPDLVNSILRGLSSISARVPVGTARVTEALQEGATRRDVAAATDLSPEVQQFIEFNIPRLAVGLGLGQFVANPATEGKR